MELFLDGYENYFQAIRLPHWIQNFAFSCKGFPQKRQNFGNIVISAFVNEASFDFAKIFTHVERTATAAS